MSHVMFCSQGPRSYFYHDSEHRKLLYCYCSYTSESQQGEPGQWISIGLLDHRQVLTHSPTGMGGQKWTHTQKKLGLSNFLHAHIFYFTGNPYQFKFKTRQGVMQQVVLYLLIYAIVSSILLRYKRFSFLKHFLV